MTQPSPPQCKLILIEGIPGSGKSITAQRLYLHLLKQGYDARWVCEHERPHPIYGDYDVVKAWQLEPGELSAFLASVISNWKNLATSVADAGRIVILESAFLQSPVSLQLLLNRPREDIIAYILAIAGVIGKADPLLIYFHQDDVPAALARIISRRGPTFAQLLEDLIRESPYGRARRVAGLEGVVDALKMVRTITDHIFEKLNIRKVAIENSAGDWPRYYEVITGFLSLPSIDGAFKPPEKAHRFVGKYHGAEPDHEFVIAADDEGLFVSGSQKRLIPKTDKVFYMQGICLEFRFDTDETSASTSVEISGPLPTFPQVWRRI
jgi:thymidylate kinase